MLLAAVDATPAFLLSALRRANNCVESSVTTQAYPAASTTKAAVPNLTIVFDSRRGSLHCTREHIVATLATAASRCHPKWLTLHYLRDRVE